MTDRELDISLPDLLTAVHRRIGNVGLRINTSTVNGQPDRYTVTVIWRRQYVMWMHRSGKRKVSADSLERALRAVIEFEDRADAELREALKVKDGA